MDDMSQTKARATFQPGVVEESAIPWDSYELLSRTIGAVTHNIEPPLAALMLSRYLDEATRLGFRKLSARPPWLRTILRNRGDAVLLELLRENWEYLGTSATVRELCHVASSTLHREKDQGAVIAYRPLGSGEFLFPLEQFGEAGTSDWARAVVEAVGNGGPSLHFLYSKRESLGGKSFAQTLRVPNLKSAAIEHLLKAVHALAAE
jgi:hypothetical protein